MNCADTNWLEAMFFADPADRRAVVERFLRREKGVLLVSAITRLEARNVFSRKSGEPEPPEWREFEADNRFYRDRLNWDLLRRDVFALVARYAHKSKLGTFDLCIIAAARLAGATRILSFDQQLKALATAEGLKVFPDLDESGKALLARLRA